ncbi:MAG: hypothetical protein M1818_001885 [Claussenomyces sp. TS43310]|nr:MAG: hypothetical protein M1818_001885 [Claussenomyces sp. TS43310]
MSDSYNHVFKQSLNSINKALISGGSSGGEAALVGAHASLIGIGTDIGGSIRIPAVLQGLYGLCPTVGRIPNDPSGRTQKYIVLPVAGPITHDLSSMELYMESLLDSEPWDSDPLLYPIPWRCALTQPPQRPLRLAFIIDDGIIKPQPPVERIARNVMAKLEGAGHEGADFLDIHSACVI